MKIEDVVARIPGWSGANPTVTPLVGGITNANYRVSVAGESFVVRIPGHNTGALGIDRNREHACTLAAHQSGIGPEVTYFDAAHEILVTRFIPGTAVSATDPSLLRRVGASLSRVHSGPVFPGVFRPLATVIDYLRQCGPAAVLPDGFSGTLAGCAAVDRALHATAPPDRPCHNDLLLANFIDDGREIRILDWEYAAMGDAYFDLGNFAANQELDEAGVRILVEGYGNPATDEALSRIALMRILSDLREAMWGQLQSKLSSLEFDFADYARRHFARCMASLSDPRLPTWLDMVGVKKRA